MTKAACYCVTANLYEKVLPSIKSLLANSSVDIVYLLTEDEEFPYPLPGDVFNVDISNQDYFDPNSPNYNSQWTYMTMMRIALPELFPRLDKILSLDADTIVTGNIDELWSLDLTGYYAAMVPEVFKSSFGHMYYNNGVALYNLESLRNDGMCRQMITDLNRNRYAFSEQDCINRNCEGKIYSLPAEYNSNRFTQRAAHPLIKHFAAEPNWFETQPDVKHYRNMTFAEALDRHRKLSNAQNR